MRTRFGIKIVGCLSFLVLAAILTACSGGGGSGGGGGGGEVELPYSGVRTPAVITAENAEHLAVTAFQLSWGLSFQLLFGTSESAGRESKVEVGPKPAVFFGLYKISRSIRNHIPIGARQAREKITDTSTEYGDCGGEAVYSLTVDNGTGKFSGTIDYSSYCEGGITFNGRVRINGVLDLYWWEIVSYKMVFESVTMSGEDQAFTIQGDIGLKYEYDGTIAMTLITITTNLLLEDHGADIAYWIDDFEFKIRYFGDDSDMTIDGRFYQSDCGYLDVSTTNDITFVVNLATGAVVWGALQLVGASNTKAQLRFSQNHTYRVIADTDGDGTYEWDSNVAGGGDNGDGDDGGDEGGDSGEILAYIGLTSQAVITRTNAERMAVEAFLGSYGASKCIITERKGKSRFKQTLFPELFELARSIREKITARDGNARDVMTAVYGGYFYGGPDQCEYTLSLNEETGDFSGTIVFRDYNVDGALFTGTVQISGLADLNSAAIVNVHLFFDGLTMDQFQGKYKIQGEGNIIYGIDDSLMMSLDILLKDQRTDLVFWINDFEIAAWYEGDYLKSTITGRFYDPEYGYVDVSTLMPVQVYLAVVGALSGGRLYFVGGNNTWAQLDNLCTTSYSVRADTDSDGDYDWDSGIHVWH